MNTSATEKGKAGEDIVVAYCLAKGWQVIDRNVRSRYGEIDIIAKTQAGILLFIEVKAYKPNAFLDPRLAITPKKQAGLRQTAQRYLAGNVSYSGARIDLAIVKGKQVEAYIPNII